MSTSKPNTGKISSEADMILSIHEEQMKAKRKDRELYYRMHKEMSPVLIRIINEAFDENDSRDDTLDHVQHIVTAYAQYVASSISAMSVLLAGSTDDRLAHRQAVARIVNELANDFLKMFLEKEEKEIMCGKGNRSETP